MDEYLIKSSESRNFTLLKKDQELGHLLYPNWFSFKAEIILSDSSIYEMGPVGFWGTTIEVKHEEVVLANFKMNWNGHIILKTFFEEREVDFMFKNKGFFKRSYILENQQHEEVVSIQQEFKWDKFNFEFVLNATPIFHQDIHNHILYLICIHCANYFTSLGTGNASSMT